MLYIYNNIYIYVDIYYIYVDIYIYIHIYIVYMSLIYRSNICVYIYMSQVMLQKTEKD